MLSVNQLQTPQVLVDQLILEWNIKHLQEIADLNQVKLRPHIKTHKSVEIFRMQESAGAVGITASKPAEALPFLEAGVKSITLAYPVIDERKLAPFLRRAQELEADINLCIDNAEGLATAYKVTTRLRFPVGIFIIINVGYNRCGLEPKDDRILELVQQMTRYKYPQFKGLLTHNGLTYDVSGWKKISRLNQKELKQLLKVKRRLEDNGITVEEISVGSTPGVLLGEGLEGVTEIRPGNYIFMDRTPVSMKLIKKRAVAQTILASVISENKHYYIIDAGKKVLSSDKRGDQNDYGLAYPLEFYPQKGFQFEVVKLSEEHGFLAKRKDINLSIGDLVRILPNHSCVVSNLTRHFCLVDGENFLHAIAVDAGLTSHGALP